jgi:hypothetical protein
MQEMKEELFADCSEEDIKLIGMFNTAARNAIESKSGIVKNKYITALIIPVIQYYEYLSIVVLRNSTTALVSSPNIYVRN